MLKSRQMYLIVILRSGNSCSYDIPLVGYLVCLSTLQCHPNACLALCITCSLAL